MSSDIQTQHFLFRHTPAPWRPYILLMRLDRPIGIWLLLFPCWWGLALAHDGIMNMGVSGWVDAFLFAVGATLMRAAGCIINDLWDRDLDKQVARTKERPLAAGTVTARQAAFLLAGLLGASFLVLLAFQSRLGIILGALSLLLVASYPLMKRVTWWPQLFLGFTFNWGALMGFAVTEEKLGAGAFLLYAAGILWTLAYDTIYAHQDKQDDALIGVKSTALLFGKKSKLYVAWFFAGAVFLFAAAKFAAAPGILVVLFLLPVIAHVYWQMRTWDPQSAENSLGIFKSNAVLGWLALLMFSV